MKVRPRRTPIDHRITGDEVDPRVLRQELEVLGVPNPSGEAEKVLRALKGGPPQLVIIQQGRMEELQDTLEELRQANENWRVKKIDLAAQRRALTALMQEALAAMRQLAGESRED